MKNRTGSGLARILGFGLAVASLGDNIIADDGIKIMTKPQTDVCLEGYDCFVDVIADSTGSDVSEEQIFSSEWDVVLPLEMNNVQANFPEKNDFYENWHPVAMQQNLLDYDDSNGNYVLAPNWRKVNNFEGPINTNGLLETIKGYFPEGTIPADQDERTFYFDTQNVVFLGNPDFFSSFQALPYAKENYPIRVVRRDPADLNADGRIDAQDVEMFTGILDGYRNLEMNPLNKAEGVEYQPLNGDIDGDGDVDLRDFYRLQQAVGRAYNPSKK